MKSYSIFNNVTWIINKSFIEDSYPVRTEKWQGLELKDKPGFTMMELLNYSFQFVMPTKVNSLREELKPNLPWADNHFMERVGGEPLNPGNTYMNWPFYKMDEKMRTENSQFSHSYMERFWPKFANRTHEEENMGIRYRFGDLDDLANLLLKEPLTRQAYLPIWFPEDTGVLHGGRVPCTLGYHFIRRDKYLHMVYYIRSCDYIRHFTDDVYMACRLLIYILDWLKKSNPEKWENIEPGLFTMHIVSLHVFESDMYNLRKKYHNENK